MIFFLKTSGILSSLILIFAGTQISLTSMQESEPKFISNQIGTFIVGLGCFTGPLLFGVSALISEKGKQKESPVVYIDTNSIIPEDTTADKSEHINQ